MFDPYQTWLRIPPDEQPPNHYRLLAIRLFENKSDVIQSAGKRQMAHLRQFRTGEHAELSQQLLNEVVGAKTCLLNSLSKTSYDAELRRQLDQQEKARPAPS